MTMQEATGITVERDTLPDGSREYSVILNARRGTVIRITARSEQGARTIAAVLQDYARKVEIH